MHEWLLPLEPHDHRTHDAPAGPCELDAHRLFAWVLDVDHEDADAPICEGLATRDLQDARPITAAAAGLLRQDFIDLALDLRMGLLGWLGKEARLQPALLLL